MRLATLNLLNGTSLDDRLVSPHRLAEAVQALGADVLGLQEVDRLQPRSHRGDLTAQVAEAMGAAHWRFVPALVGTPGGQWRAATDEDDEGTEPAYGVGLVSRWPVRSWQVTRLGAAPVRSPIVLPGTRQVVWLRDEPRVGLAAVVETPYGVVTVATTHLSFVPVWNGVQLRRLTADLARLPGPRVLLGDLNMPRPVPAVLTRWQPLARTATYPSWEPRLQLDHVLASGELPPVTAVEAPRLAVSDHRAVLVELTRHEPPELVARADRMTRCDPLRPGSARADSVEHQPDRGGPGGGGRRVEFVVHPVDRTSDRLLQISGELDIATVASLRQAVRSALDAAPGTLLVDLTGTRFIDSTGCRELVRTAKTGAAAGVTVELVVPPENWRVRRVVDFVQLSSVVAVRDTVPEP